MPDHTSHKACIAYILIGIGGLIGAFVFADQLSCSHWEKIKPWVVTFISMMSAVLLGAITLAGRASDIVTQVSEETREIYRKTFVARLSKLTALFYLYLLSFVIILLPTSPLVMQLGVGFFMASMVASFILPLYIITIYKDYYSSLL